MQAGVLTLSQRLGFPSDHMFSILRKKSGCMKISSWKKILGVDVTVYDSKLHGVKWIAFGIHIQPWVLCPDHFARGTGLGAQQTANFQEPDWLNTALLSPTQIEFQSQLEQIDTRENKMVHDLDPPTVDNATQKTCDAPVMDEKSFSAKCCKGLCSKRVDQFGAIDPAYCTERWDLFRGGWRSKKCALSVANGEAKCRSCASDYSNLNRRNHPLLFSDPIMQSIFPAASSCEDAVQSLYDSMGDDAFVHDPSVTRVAKMIKLVYNSGMFRPLKLADNVNFVLCGGNGRNCTHFALLKDKCKLHFCTSCRHDHDNTSQRKRRKDSELKSPEPDKKYKTGSRCNWRYMSPEDTSKRAAAQTRDRNKVSAKLNRMSKNLCKHSRKFDREDNEDIVKLLTHAFEDVKNNPEELKRSIMGALLESEIKRAGSNEQVCSGNDTEILKVDECATFVNQVLEEMEKFSLHLCKKVSLH